MYFTLTPPAQATDMTGLLSLEVYLWTFSFGILYSPIGSLPLEFSLWKLPVGSPFGNFPLEVSLWNSPFEIFPVIVPLDGFPLSHWNCPFRMSHWNCPIGIFPFDVCLWKSLV